MKRVFGILVSTVFFNGLSEESTASNSPVRFGVNVTHSCSIVVTQGGTLAINRDNRILSSRLASGTSGSAVVTTSGPGFRLFVDAPTSFDVKPAIDTTAHRFKAWHRSRGATRFNLTRKARSLKEGTSNITVHMEARKTSGHAQFEAGLYRATTVLRCE